MLNKGTEFESSWVRTPGAMARDAGIISIGMICALLCPLTASTPVEREAHMLVLYSLSPDSVAPGPLDELVRPAIEKKLGRRIDVFTGYLELQRFPENQHQRKFADSLETRYRKRYIDVIVPMGFPALEFVRRYMSEIWPRTPICLCRRGVTLVQRICSST